MPETPISLLERLRLRPDSASWQRLIDLYTPLIRNWFLRYALQPSDADDLVQETVSVFLSELPEFRHDLRRGAFRRWLRNIVLNRLRYFWRERRAQPKTVGDIEQRLNQLEDPTSNLSQLWDQEHDQHVASRLLELVESEFEPVTWQAFRLLVLEGQRTAEVAATLGITANAVRIAKARVLGRIRRETEGISD